MIDAPSDPKAELATQISSIVTETFAIRRQVVLLSFLGQALRKRGYDFRQILGEQKLADFIKERLADEIKLVSTPAGPLVLAAIPADVEIENEIDPFGASRRVSEGPAREHKRELLIRAAWFAFSHALAPGKGRVLRLEPDVEYEDYDLDTPEKPSGYDIPPELIVPAGSPLTRSRRDELIYENVQSWAAQREIPFRSLIATQTAGGGGGRRSALDVLLSSLSEGDLGRITMPLDLVAKLRRKQQ